MAARFQSAAVTVLSAVAALAFWDHFVLYHYFFSVMPLLYCTLPCARSEAVRPDSLISFPSRV
ncbi:hypothetical protein JHK85_039838 [Glycine max]|nr:hypothetical protein JHK85_039838 [Glycine max]